MQLPVFSVMQCTVMLHALREQEKMLIQRLASDQREPNPDDPDQVTRTIWRLGVVEVTARALQVHLDYAHTQEDGEDMGV